MQNVITIRGTTIGNGRPKVIVPIVDATVADILKTAADLCTLRLDCIEWRADFFEHVLDEASLCALLKQLRATLGNTLLLTTYRRKQEGGEGTATVAEYCAFCQAVIASGCTDLLDIEHRTEQGGAQILSSIAHNNATTVVQSYHNFAQTPSESELIAILGDMQRAGADIAKIAVMPRCAADVLTLLSATEKVAATATTPLITMSMGELGKATRLCGATFGSTMTFASVGTASAPGQIALSELNQALDALYPPSIPSATGSKA